MFWKTSITVMLTLMLAGCNSYPSLFGKQMEDHSTSYLTKAIKREIPEDFFPTNINIVSLGDSLTQGVGDSSESGGYIPYLVSYLEQNRGIKEAEFNNHGVRGNRTTDLLERLKTPQLMMDIQQADAIVITIGGNDIMKVVKDQFTNLTMQDFYLEANHYEERLEEIFSIIRQYNKDADIYFVGLYNPFGKWISAFQELDMIMDDWNSISQEIVTRDPNGYFIRIDDAFSNSDENLLYKEDYFHPNDRGYEIIASRIYDEMKERIKENIKSMRMANEGEKNGENLQ
ncbi:SGNH/GDSL hydrolase family protein [Methanobrevibacter sp.]|uniref:SGNH/GDSL hydrolase family protein n=1 Tax=Methanobrevibacter sp. TaxID=66852 RepID=UPI00388FBBF2